MATLLLTAVGTLVGGPLGGALGALAGRQIDGALIGSPNRDGPRVKELGVTTSSYGQPIARHAGTMRAAGTVIWATDLKESRETSGGSKGQPKTTSYSYSVSFAVVLASSPIEGIGRIWADGNLLRGGAGELKVGGTLRLYRGFGDQPCDPLIAAAEGDRAPAHRHCAYVVLEDLQLAEFGNRIPALTFEVVADTGAVELVRLLGGLRQVSSVEAPLPNLAGYSHEGGSFAAMLDAIHQVYPLASVAGADGLTLAAQAHALDAVAILPPAVAGWEEEDFGTSGGNRRRRDLAPESVPHALRYYDIARDYQPGLQRAEGKAPDSRVQTIEFPGALQAANARHLANTAARRAKTIGNRLSYRAAELDPSLAPGALVGVPGTAGIWRIASLEWRERAVEYGLERVATRTAPRPPADPGVAITARDLALTATELQAFELPWDGAGSASTPRPYAAVSSAGAGWKGAQLYLQQGDELVPIGFATRERARIGSLAQALPASACMRLESGEGLMVELVGEDFDLPTVGLAALAQGANRALVGSEIVQFAHAESLGGGRWMLSHLLRGRGGTEWAAALGHAPDTPFTLIDGALTSLDPGDVPPLDTTRIAAIGAGDADAVIASLANAGATLQPPSPVHGSALVRADGGLALCWRRRARGQWTWPDTVDLPLIEEREHYTVGLGDPAAPQAQWQVTEPELAFSPGEYAALASDHAGQPLWVRQNGSFAVSRALLLHRFPT